jgi:HAD superfamily hydrolase (TIGR01490 family)
MKLALFDLDYTLLTGDSDHAWGQFLVQEGIRDADDFGRRNDQFWAEYKAGTLDIHAYLRFALEPIAGKSPEQLAPLHERFMALRIRPMMTDGARALITRHRHDLCAVVTATNAFVTAPIARELGVSHLIACEVEMRDGYYTGLPIGVPSFREGKITRVETWLAGLGQSFADFEETWFYSDSLNDLPLLERVSHPVAVNPDQTLRTHAQTQGWPIIDIK